MPCRYNTFDCYGLIGFEGKRGLTLTVVVAVFVCCCCCCCCFGGHTVSLYSAYNAPNKFSSLLFSPGTLNGHVDNVV